MRTFFRYAKSAFGLLGLLAFAFVACMALPLAYAKVIPASSLEHDLRAVTTVERRSVMFSQETIDGRVNPGTLQAAKERWLKGRPTVVILEELLLPERLIVFYEERP